MVQDLDQSTQSHPELELSKADFAVPEADKPGLVSRLWQEAYAHPYEAGLGAAAAIASAGVGIYALSKGDLMPSCFKGAADVLLVEDTPGLGNAFKDALEQNGHKVTWVTGIKTLEPLTAFTPDGGEMALTRRYKIAFLDGDLGADRLTGPEIVGTLAKRARVIGTSTVEHFNVAMRQNSLNSDGTAAAITGNKGVVFAALVGNRLDMLGAVKAPEAVQASLDALKVLLRAPENIALKKEANTRLQKFLLGK